MIITLWFLSILVFLGLASVMVLILSRSSRFAELFRVFKKGMHDALYDCGLHSKSQIYHCELYKWTIEPEEDVCEESLEKSKWPAMDIADWMEAGLPHSHDGQSRCGRDCHCSLTRVIPHELTHRE